MLTTSISIHRPTPSLGGKCIRFHWVDDEEAASYFEFIIHHIELTGATALEITDFATPDEKADAIELWDTQVAELRRTLGI